MSSFLDNSGQLIVDTVLTDEGRKRLARGDFQIALFAFGDSHVNYGTYDPNHPSGEAYYDQVLKQTPIFEALTNNALMMSSHLTTYVKNNYLYLPVIKINDMYDQAAQQHPTLNMHVLCVDEATENEFSSDSSGALISGIMKGENSGSGGYIRLDQGLDTSEIAPANTLDADLLESQYLVMIDNRFASLVDPVSGALANQRAVDDDFVATYLLSMGSTPNFVKRNANVQANVSAQVIAGPRGSYLVFRLKASIDANSTSYLFDTLGTAAVTDATFQGVHGAGVAYRFIDTTVRVAGGTTGYTIDVPVRLVKLS